MPQTSVICALCARGTPSPYIAQATYHAPTGAYHEFRKEFYITRRKALYHVALSRETNDRFNVGQDDKRYIFRLKAGVVTTKGIFFIFSSIHSVLIATNNDREYKQNSYQSNRKVCVE